MELNENIKKLKGRKHSKSETTEQCEMFLLYWEEFLKCSVIDVHVTTSQFFTTLKDFVFAHHRSDFDTIDYKTLEKCNIYQKVVKTAFDAKLYAYNNKNLVWKATR